MSELLADALGPFPAEKRQMFGFPAYFVNGNMFTGVFEDVIILRLADPDREELHHWLQRSFSWASGLTPKVKKPRKTS